MFLDVGSSFRTTKPSKTVKQKFDDKGLQVLQDAVLNILANMLCKKKGMKPSCMINIMAKAPMASSVHIPLFQLFPVLFGSA